MSFAAYHGLEPRPGEATPRGTIVPPWYIPHADTSLRVISPHGRHLGFTVGEVAVERRWAIDAEGRCMPQQDFEQMLLQWRIGQYQWSSPPRPAPDLTLEPIPMVESFVSRGPDPANAKRLCDITYPQKRESLLKVREPVVDQSLVADPRWAKAPSKATEPEPEPLVAEAPKPPKPDRKIAKIPCPDCGAMVGGVNGLRLHKRHKHKDAA